MTVVFIAFPFFMTSFQNSEIYEQHKNEQSYEFGKLIAIVVRPIPSNYYYIKPDSYSLIEADSWWPSELSQSHSSTLKHDMLPFIKCPIQYLTFTFLDSIGMKLC